MYTAGFYVRDDSEGRIRNVSVRLRGDRTSGMRALHANKYTFRSDGEKRESLLRAAWTAPEMFSRGVVRAHLFVLRPQGKRAWDGLLAVSFPVPLGDSGGRPLEREFGALLRHGPRIPHRFTRTVRLQPNHPDSDSVPVVTFLEPVTIEPGSYTLTTVLSEPDEVTPDATRVRIDVPEIPRKELFLVGPLLGRRAGPNLVIRGNPATGEDRIAAESAFEPLLVGQLGEISDIVALTQACFVGSPKRADSIERAGPAVHRTLRDDEGSKIGSLPPVALALDGGEKVHCQNLTDVLPMRALEGGGYVFEATLEGQSGAVDDSDPATARFAVSPSSSP